MEIIIYVSSSVYKIPTTTTQGKQWVVSFRWYKVVGDNMLNHSQETILTLRTTSVVKAMIVGGNMKQNTQNVNIDINLELSSIFLSIVFTNFV